MNVLVTGSQGFIGKNLMVRLKELKVHNILQFYRGMDFGDLERLVLESDFIFHLAGVNRPENGNEFQTGNSKLTQTLVDILKKLRKTTPIVYTSSIQSDYNNPYGASKRLAEKAILSLPKGQGFIFKLPNIFGKWSRPNYNSVVATFCYNTANGVPHIINDPNAVVNLVYIDDLIDNFFSLLEANEKGALPKGPYLEVSPVYTVTVGDLSRQIMAFDASKSSLSTEDTGHGLVRALYATYLSYLRPEQFSYDLSKNEDPRGTFVEILKTKSAGQFSFFTAYPGVTRGGHYHHTKVEKFLVIKGKARYRFRHILTQETYEIVVDSAEDLRIVETIPGWSHDITNVGSDELIVMLWANEVFDPNNPDTIKHEV